MTRGRGFKDVTGTRFGRLVVLEYAMSDRRGEAVWRCRCDCGKTTSVRGSHLRLGRVISCGCYRNGQSARHLNHNPTCGNFKHGGTHTRLYTTWSNMKTRCLNSKNRAFKWYGATGVEICEEWLVFENFRDWATDSGYSDELTIDRIDPFGNYEPKNCRWMPISEQRANQRRSHNAINS